MNISKKLRSDIVYFLGERQATYYRNNDTNLSSVFIHGFKGYAELEDKRLVDEFRELESPRTDSVFLDAHGVDEYEELDEGERDEFDEIVADYEKIKSALEAIL